MKDKWKYIGVGLLLPIALAASNPVDLGREGYVTQSQLDEVAITQVKASDLTPDNVNRLAIEKLRWLGFYSGNSVTEWDGEVIRSVMAFQYAYQLDADGIMGAQTKEHLFNGGMGDRVEQAKPIALMGADELLGGYTPVVGDRVAGVAVTSPFGWRRHPVSGTNRFHGGVDAAHPAGTPVYAVGTYVEAWWDDGGGGVVVRQQHPSLPNVWFYTMHCSNALGLDADWYYNSRTVETWTISPNKLGAQTTVAHTGSTGVGTGAHSHTSVRINGVYTQPHSNVFSLLYPNPR